MVQVIACNVFQSQPCLGLPRSPAGKMLIAKKVSPGLRCLDLFEAGRRTTVEHVATLLSGSWSHVNNPVGMPDDIQIVFHHEERSSGRPQSLKRYKQGLSVGRV